MSEKELAYYLSLPYRVEVTPDEEGDGYNAAIRELKGCMAFGETVAQAYAELQGVKRVWLETALERGWRIPEPPSPDEKAYSGEFRVRLPGYLHRDLVRLAEGEGTSLNQLVVALLAEGAERLRTGAAGRPGIQDGVARVPAQVAPSRPVYEPSPAASEPHAEYKTEG